MIVRQEDGEGGGREQWVERRAEIGTRCLNNSELHLNRDALCLRAHTCQHSRCFIGTRLAIYTCHWIGKGSVCCSCDILHFHRSYH